MGRFTCRDLPPGPCVSLLWRGNDLFLAAEALELWKPLLSQLPVAVLCLGEWSPLRRQRAPGNGVPPCLPCALGLLSLPSWVSLTLSLSFPVLPLTSHFISSLSFSSPCSSPRPLTSVPVNFCTALPPSPQSLLSLPRDTHSRSLPSAPTGPPVALKGPGLPAASALIPQRPFSALILYLGCAQPPARGPGARLPEAPAEFKVPHRGPFAGLTRMRAPAQCAEAQRLWG